MTDAEWTALAPLLAATRGRPPADRRRTLDAIFWVACSRGPWRDLPPELGRADTAHRTLRRYARSGLLDRLLRAAPRLATLEWRIARAWRRACRLMSMASLLLARDLGLVAALPCSEADLPNPDLSETLRRARESVLESGLPILRSGLKWLMLLHRMVGGRPQAFRTTT
ncbi:transposase [Falsiroseomonas sp. HC035]|uniref:transposase n=1 Tax=Falsiroseomonas sp. HC035 TaxID=3390999 RepID=UPI003D317D95